jgi:hypothetical protein
MKTNKTKSTTQKMKMMSNTDPTPRGELPTNLVFTSSLQRMPLIRVGKNKILL